MNLVQTQEGAEYVWQVVLGAHPGPGLRVHLLGSPYTPAHNSTEASFAAAELAVAGYAPLALGPGLTGWTVIPIAQGGQATNQQAQWAFGAACTVYGGWMELIGTGYSWFGWLFDSPFIFGAAGGPFYLVASPTLISVP